MTNIFSIIYSVNNMRMEFSKSQTTTILSNHLVSAKGRPCYKYFYDLDALWIHAIGSDPPRSPRMHNMAKDQNWPVVPNAHSGIHDTLQVLVQTFIHFFTVMQTFSDKIDKSVTEFLVLLMIFDEEHF